MGGGPTADRASRHSRKDKLHERRARERAAARAKLPMPDGQMRLLFDALDAALPQRRCDHSLRIVRDRAERQAVDFDALAAWCRDNGGHCDCEVLANCEQRWQDAKHDADW